MKEELFISSNDFLTRIGHADTVANRTKTTAITLSPNRLGYHEQSGWNLSGDIHEDYYKWVNEFEAVHSKYGKVRGNLEEGLYYTSEKALKRFIEVYKSAIEIWDYMDI